jgi:ribosome-associated protein
MQRRREPEPDAFSDGPSKTQLKRAMTELQDLSIALLDLPDAQLDQIEIDEPLRDALRELRGIRSHGAKRRQAQYVGKLMRNADEEPLRQALDAYRMGKSRDAQAFKEIEHWRERLLASDEALTAWTQAYPGADTQQLRSLIRNARRDLAAARAADSTGEAPPHKGRAYRELFQKLRATLQSAASAA